MLLVSERASERHTSRTTQRNLTGGRWLSPALRELAANGKSECLPAVPTCFLQRLCESDVLAWVLLVRSSAAWPLESATRPARLTQFRLQYHESNIAYALYFGLAAAMLGISGFESSSQFVEEQAPGVFPLTLRNMWAGVMIFNPLISLAQLSVLPLNGVGSEPGAERATIHWNKPPKNWPGTHDWLNASVPVANIPKSVGLVIKPRETVLADLAYVTGGKPFELLVCIDAFVVLSGAVLTAYVGVTGLIRRMADDRCLPQFLLQTNALRGTNRE